MPRYFLDLPEDSTPRLWNPHAGPRPERPDTRYFGAVFTEMEMSLRDPDIDVHMTWDVQRLPDYGDRVVAIVLGDEAGKIPRYVGRVRAVFKAYGTHPVLGTGPLRDPSLTGLIALAQFGVRWLKWLPGGAAHARRAAGRRLRREPALSSVFPIPAGTCNQVDLPQIPIAERGTDLFFAGSVEHHGPGWRPLGTPKSLSRRAMLKAVDQLRQRRPDLRIEVQLTAGFDASIARPAMAYSHALMDAKVCLAPRGTAPETWRVFEGLRYGCLVVADRVPSHRFLAGAPILQLDRWSDLEHVLGPVLDDPAALEEWHARGLEWWHAHCSEAAVGRYLAERLNELSAGTPVTPLGARQSTSVPREQPTRLPQ